MNISRATRHCLFLVMLAFSQLLNLQVAAGEFQQVDLRDDWGVEPVHLRLTADDYMVEFRYEVVDEIKARVLSNRKELPRLKVMKSEARLAVPFFRTVGYIKSNRRHLKVGKHYTMMFSNEGRHLKSGDTVRLQVEGHQSPVLTVD